MLPSTRPYDDHQPQGPFYLDAEPQYSCSSKDCDAVAWEPGEHHECIACKRRFCADCLIAIGPEKYCPTCAKCACGQPAITSCDECGRVGCQKCIGDSNFCKACADPRARVA